MLILGQKQINTDGRIEFSKSLKIERTEVLLITGKTDASTTAIEAAFSGREDL